MGDDRGWGSPARANTCPTATHEGGGPRMKFGLAFANTGPFTGPEGAAAMAEAAEDAGFSTLWTVEHVVVPHGYASTYPYARDGRMPGGEEFDIPDPLIWLAWVAARTQSIRLATGILILPQRNPVITAKEVATLDTLSGGRVVLGIGVGWLEEEFRVLGVVRGALPRPPPRPPPGADRRGGPQPRRGPARGPARRRLLPRQGRPAG